MTTISLHGAHFFAYHGFYPEEQKLGNHFIIDIDVALPAIGELGDDLDNTINYEQLHTIAANEMQHPQKLIETVAQRIIDQIKSNWPTLQTISVTVKKLNPYLAGRVDHSAVNISYKAS